MKSDDPISPIHATGEQLVTSLFDNNTAAILIIDPADGAIVDANAAAAKFYGWTRAQLRRMKILDINILSPEQIRQEMEKVQKLERVHFEFRHRRADGSIRDVEVFCSGFSTPERDLLHSIIHDITERKQAEGKLRQSEGRLRAIIEAAPESIFVNSQGRFIYINKAMLTILGAAEESDLLNTEVMERIDPEYRDTALQRIRINTMRGVPSPAMEMVFRRLDGSRVYAEGIAVPIDFEGQAGHLVMIRDITEHKEAEEKARESEARFRTFVEAAPEAIFVHSEGRFAFMNPAALKLFRAQKESDLLGTFHFDRVVPEYHEKIKERNRCSDETGMASAPMEMELIRLDGSLVPVETTAVAIKYKGDDAVLVFLRDISRRKQNAAEKKQLEEQLRQTRQLESLGVLAGGIAHDFNNLLGGVFGYMEMARACLGGPENEKPATYLENALSIFGRAKSLTSQLLTFAKGGNPIKKSGNLPTFIKDTARFILTGSGIHVEYRFPEDLPGCDFDENLMGQVIDNIIINAKQAMPDGGTITITAGNTVVKPGQSAVLAAGDYVRIAISDTGPGIAEEILPRIFDPFFTTKEKGSGLGLATSFSIIKKHGGLLSVSSAGNRGTTFYIDLPAKALPAEAGDRAENGPNGQKSILDFKTLRILVMDDEDYIRDICREILRTLHCGVDGAKDGREALRMIREAREKGNPYHCVMMDLTIPGNLGGREAVEQLRQHDKEIVALAMSGYSDDPVMAEPARYGFNGSIAKPFNRQALIQELGRHF